MRSTVAAETEKSLEERIEKTRTATEEKLEIAIEEIVIAKGRQFL